MMNQGFAYNSPKDNSTTRIVAITAVDPAARMASGMTRERSTLDINCSFPVGGLIVTPAVGEQWYVQKLGTQYVLLSRLPANSAELLTEATEGQVQVGTTSGPLTLHGSEVQVESKLKLGKTLYRDTNGELESSTDGGDTWVKVRNLGNVVTSVANKKGDVTLDIADIKDLGDTLSVKADLIDGKVPDTQIKHRVFQYASRAKFPAQGKSDTFYLDSAKKDIYAWIGGSYVVISTSLDPICDNPFFNALQDLGTGLSPLGQVLTGFQNFIDQIMQALFCGFADNLTPQAILTALQGVIGLFTNNPFVQGLANLMETPVGHLLTDAVNGLTQFLQQLFGLFFCNFTGTLTPQVIITSIRSLLDSITNNPFFAALKALAEAMGKNVINLLDGALHGAVEMIKIIFGFFTCTPLNNAQLSGLQTFFGGTLGGVPAQILKFVQDVFASLQNNPFLAQLRTLAEQMGHSITSLFDGAIHGATELIRVIINMLTCGLTGTQSNAIAEVLKGLTAGVFNPAALISQLQGLVALFSNNPIVQVLNSVTTSLGLGGANLLEKVLNGLTGIVTWFLKVLKTFLPFVPWQNILPFGTSFWNTVNSTSLGIPLVDNPITSFNPSTAVNDFLKNILGLDVSKIPQLDDNGQLGTVDILVGLNDWIKASIFQPIIKTILTATGIDLTKLGIDPFNLDTLDLGALGDWASTLLHNLGTIPAELLNGMLPSGMLGTIPVSNIANITPNLLNQGSFGDPGTIEAADGWTWDGTENAPNSTGGSAKTTISSIKERYLYSKQAIPVAMGDRLAINASIKTYGFGASPTSSEPISIAIVPFIGTYAGVPEVMGTSGSSTGWKTIGRTAETFFEVTNPTWTSVIVRLGVDSRATGGSVWWDEIAAYKVGLLVQDNVDSLIAAWNAAIGGLIGQGSPTTGKTWEDLLQAAINMRNRANEGVLGNTNTVNLLNFFPEMILFNLLNVKADGTSSIGTLLFYLSYALSVNNGKAGYTVNSVLTAAQEAFYLASHGANGIDGLKTNPQSYISSLANVIVDGIVNMTTLLSQMTKFLSNNTSLTATVDALYAAGAAWRQQTGNTNTQLETTNRNLFGTPTAGTEVLVNALPTDDIGREISTAGSGALLVRNTTAPQSVTPNVGPQVIPAGFFTGSSRTTADINIVGGNTGFQVTLGGWYMVEIAYKVNANASWGWGLAPVLYVDGYPRKYGTDVMYTWFGVASPGYQRYVQNSFIVYLPAYHYVQAGYDCAMGAAANTDVLGGGNGSSDTYMSISLLNRSFN